MGRKELTVRGQKFLVKDFYPGRVFDMIVRAERDLKDDPTELAITKRNIVLKYLVVDPEIDDDWIDETDINLSMELAIEINKLVEFDAVELKKEQTRPSD